jgi:hypothetical protein
MRTDWRASSGTNAGRDGTLTVRAARSRPSEPSSEPTDIHRPDTEATT